MRQSLQFYYFIFLFILFPVFLVGQTDCRLQIEELKPVIQRFNPFFSNHSWDGDSQIELARMGQNRLVLITQDGCKRHHILFNLVIDPQVITNRSDFWIKEVRALIHKAYWGNNEYEEFAADFEKNFIKKFSAYGVNNQFNFPVGKRNFICEINYTPSRGAKITIEMVRFIFKENVHVKRLGIPQDQDDGWYGNARKP